MNLNKIKFYLITFTSVKLLSLFLFDKVHYNLLMYIWINKDSIEKVGYNYFRLNELSLYLNTNDVLILKGYNLFYEIKSNYFINLLRNIR